MDLFKQEQCSGWQCPICKKINAPWVQQCPCNGQVDWVTTTATSCNNETVTIHNYKPDLTKEHNHIPQIDTYYGECGEDSDDEQN